jgi:RNA-directed DNA polymerase
MREHLYSFTALWRAYRACRQNKRNTRNALAFEIDAEANLLALQRELMDRTYRPGRSICFVTDGPKPREVFAADFRDRIVHHLLVEQLEPRFEPRFIHDSYACRRGKGVLAASDRLMEYLRRITANGRRPAWAIKLDVASFFPSIDKHTLFAIIAQRVRDPELRWLTEVILFHDPTGDYRFKPGPRRVPPPASAHYPIAAQKSLFGHDNVRGLPIGNLTSQFWANVYLNELDQFVKRTLRCRFYLRYVDDLILLDEDPERLRRWRDQIGAYLGQRLQLRLREAAAEPRQAGRGIDFVGWKTWWDHRVPRRQTLAKCDGRLRRFEHAALRPMWNGLAQRLDSAPSSGHALCADIEALRAVLASYSGHLRHGASLAGWRTIGNRHPWLERLCVGGARNPWRLRVRWRARPLGGTSFGRQYRQFLCAAGERTLVFCQVGTFIELYGPQREVATRVLRLVRVRLGRGGYAFGVGFPVRLRTPYIARALRAGYAVADVREVASVARPVERRLVALWLPAITPS